MKNNFGVHRFLSNDSTEMKKARSTFAGSLFQNPGNIKINVVKTKATNSVTIGLEDSKL